jgi:hypothetical protein
VVGKSLAWLRVVLFLVGLAVVVTGINVSFGGIATLGWQGSTSFFEVTDARRFQAQDSHVRFLGGLWLGIGVLFLLGGLHPRPCRRALLAALGLAFLGGLARLTQGRLDVTLGPDIAGSFVAELVLFPLLALWVARAVKDRGAA